MKFLSGSMLAAAVLSTSYTNPCFQGILDETKALANYSWPPPVAELDDIIGIYLSCISPAFAPNCKPPASLENCIVKSFDSDLDAIRIVGKAFDDVIDLLCFQSVIDKPLPVQLIAVTIEFFHIADNFMPLIISHVNNSIKPMTELFQTVRQYKIVALVLANLIPLSESDFEDWHVLGLVFYYCGYVVLLLRNPSPRIHTKILTGLVFFVITVVIEKVLIALHRYIHQQIFTPQLIALFFRYFVIFRNKFLFALIAPIIIILRVQLTGPLFLFIVADVLLFNLLNVAYSSIWSRNQITNHETNNVEERKRGRPLKKDASASQPDRFNKYMEFIGPRF